MEMSNNLQTMANTLRAGGVNRQPPPTPAISAIADSITQLIGLLRKQKQTTIEMQAELNGAQMYATLFNEYIVGTGET